MLIKCQTLFIYRAHINSDFQTAARIVQLENSLMHWSRVCHVPVLYSSIVKGDVHDVGMVKLSLSVHILFSQFTFPTFSFFTFSHRFFRTACIKTKACIQNASNNKMTRGWVFLDGYHRNIRNTGTLVCSHVSGVGSFILWRDETYCGLSTCRMEWK